MKRFLLPATTLLLAGAFAAAALAWAGRPAAPPPRPAQAGGPPAAWAESAARSAWLDFGTYCWKTACADYIPPAARPGLRTFRTRVGQRIRIHLGFAPRSVSARVLPATAFTKLPARAIVSWRVTKLGILEVQAKAGPGSASYLVSLR